MANSERVPYLRRRLGAKFKRMRERSGHTLVSAAAELDKTRSALQRIESGETKADVHLARSMMDLYDCREDLVDEIRAANKPPWYVAYGVKHGAVYLDVETEATHIDEFSVQVVPGLLQTEAYVRALFQGHGRSATRAVTVRRVRQKRLTSEDHPLSITAVIDEAALVRPVGGPDLMREQLLHLSAVAALPTVRIHVLPFDVGVYPAMPGSFIVLNFPEPEYPGYLYAEYVTGLVHNEDETEVQKARLIFRKLLSHALSPAESVALIERLAMEAFSGSPDLA